MKKKVLSQRDKIKFTLNIKQDIPWTETQKRFIDLALSKSTKCMLVKGCAGTSKTFLGVHCALTLLNEHKISDIVLVRSVVESSENHLGFLPGDLDEKFSVYIQPFMDKLNELLPQEQIKMLKTDSRLIPVPVNYARGLHWAGKAVIIDEAQNFSLSEFLTLLTRIGEFSKVFVLGDLDQSDLVVSKKNDFNKLYDMFNNDESIKNGIHVFEFTEEDILRSEFVKFIIKKFKTLK